MKVVVEDILTNYHIIGKGKTILLLHGWGDSSIGMKDLSISLSDKFKVITLDLPGFGSSESPDKVWGLDDYADFVQKFLDKINEKTFVIAGHSNGGAIAIRGLARKMNAEYLVLLASAGIRGEYKGRIKALRYITKAGKYMVSPLPKNIKNILRKKVYNTVGSDMLVAEHLQETFKKVVEDDVRENCKYIKIPTLLIYGDKDESTPLRYGQIFAGIINNSKLEVIQNAGHMLPSEHTDDISNKIKEFINV